MSTRVSSECEYSAGSGRCQNERFGKLWVWSGDQVETRTVEAQACGIRCDLKIPTRETGGWGTPQRQMIMRPSKLRVRGAESAEVCPGSEAHLGAAEIGQILLGCTTLEVDFEVHGGEVGGRTPLEKGLLLFREIGAIL